MNDAKEEAIKALAGSESAGWDDLTAELCRESCAFFAQEVLSGPPQPPYNGRFMVSEHHEEWDRLIREHDRLCILAPRDHSKTFMFDFAYPIWKAVHEPGSIGFIFSATQDQAVRILGDIKSEIESNPKLQWLVPNRSNREAWSSTRIHLSNGCKIYARGYGTKVRGAHPCLDYDTEIVTENGIEKIGDLEDQERTILTGLGTWKKAKFWKSGHREVVTAQFGNKYTRDKQKITLTPDHKLLTEDGWKDAGDIPEGQTMKIAPSNHDLLFEVMGWLWNDGKYFNNQQQIMFSLPKDEEALERYRPFFTNKPEVGNGCSYRVSLPKIEEAKRTIGTGNRIKNTLKKPPVLLTAQQKVAWIRGMFSANGTVIRSVRLKLACKELLEYIEGVLHEFGVRTTPIVKGTQEMDGKTFTNYMLHVHKKSINHYLSVFGFVQTYKTEKAKSLAFPFYRLLDVDYGRRPRRTLVQMRDVFDFSVENPSCEQEMSAISNGFIVHNCWIVVDDALNDETAYSELVREKQIEYFYTAITNMIIPDGQIIVCGTPFHLLDMYGDLEKNPEYKFARFPAIKEDGSALWPDRYDIKSLQKRKQEIGEIRFTREFMTRPISSEMSLFPGHLFQGAPTEQPLIKLGAPKKFWDELGVQIFMGVDFAMSSSVQADFTVIWTMGVDKHGNRWIVDIFRAKGLPYQQQLSKIISIARKYEPGLIFLESNQMQRIFGDELIRTTDLPIKKFIMTAARNDPLKGIPGLRVLLENGKFRIPRGDAHSVEMTDIWMNEMQSFTWHNGKLQGVGAHDDTVASLFICDQAIRQGAFSFTFGEDNVEFSGTFDDWLEAENAEEAPEESKATGNLVDDDFGGFNSIPTMF